MYRLSQGTLLKSESFDARAVISSSFITLSMRASFDRKPYFVFFEPGCLGKVIDKNVCVNKYALALLYLMEAQLLDLFGKELGIEGDGFRGFAVPDRDHAACGQSHAFRLFDNEMNPSMLS